MSRYRRKGWDGEDHARHESRRHASASYWAEKRRHQQAQVSAVQRGQKFGDGLMRTVRDRARRDDDIVSDGGAGDTREVESALRVADLALMPVQPTGLDVWTLGLMDDRVGKAHAVNDALRASVVLNRASPNPKDNDAADARHASDGGVHLQLASGGIGGRVAVKRAAPAGFTVLEYKP